MLSTQATTALSSLAPALPAASGCGMEPLETLTNEALYASLVANETPLSEGLYYSQIKYRQTIWNML